MVYIACPSCGEQYPLAEDSTLFSIMSLPPGLVVAWHFGVLEVAEWCGIARCPKCQTAVTAWW